MLGTDSDFSQDQDTWNEAVFRNYDHFNVVKFCGRGEREERRYFDFTKAKDFTSRDKRRLLYVVSKSGRGIHLDRKDWSKWTELWNNIRRNGRAVQVKV